MKTPKRYYIPVIGWFLAIGEWLPAHKAHVRANKECARLGTPESCKAMLEAMEATFEPFDGVSISSASTGTFFLLCIAVACLLWW